MSKFVIAIGGTGMRCLEAFIHLCAIGMFDNEEINIMTLDTDQNNGNKGRVEDLVELYRRIKSSSSQNIDGGTPNVNTFFSAKLNLYKFYTNYTDQNRRTFSNLADINSGSPEVQQQNQDLANLFLDPGTVQQFSLEQGYRAQTHLGSMLMYHGIVEAAINVHKKGDAAEEQEKKLVEFIKALANAGQDAKVFVFGSVFGGTGASSIPIIPRALKEAIRQGVGNLSLDLDQVKFGATLLTEYFTFNTPNKAQLNSEHVIADANNFALNSQAALQFYQGDTTVKKSYKRLYHIGWPQDSKPLMDQDKLTHTITGGKEQKNDCHVVELMCACAAYDFFNEENQNDNEAQYLFREVGYDTSFNFSEGDFLGQKGSILLNKLGAFLSFAHIVLSKNGAALYNNNGVKGFLKRFNEQKIPDYNTLTDDEAKEIDEYLKLFAYDFKNNRVERGWLYQVYNSVNGGKLLFKPNAFTEIPKELENIDPGDIFLDDKHNWDKGGIFSNRFDTFVKKLIDSACRPKDNQKVNTTKERFLAHVYNGITIAQHFN